MKIINGKQLGYMPNGTVFSDMDASLFNKYYGNGSIPLQGLHIMCGHNDSWFPVESGMFNGVLHMVDYVHCLDGRIVYDFNDPNGGNPEDYWDTITDTDFNDYNENDLVLVYEKEDVEKLIENLQWALNECKEKE